jgi:predicted transcriptional regulator
MKAILLSIRPNWCKLIWSGMKTVEVRKTRPKLETPFKVYIYCTGHDGWVMKFPKAGVQKMDRRIIGEFTCDKIDKLVHIGTMMDINILTLDGWYKPADALLQAACLTKETAKKYLQGRNGYGWHISDLKIWDEPVRIEDFWAIQPCTHRGDCCTCRRWAAEKLICRGEVFGIERPPQSWCYVEDGG